jgi:hypothetical protein
VRARMWRKEILALCWWECKSVWKIVWRFIKKSIQPTYDPSIPLLGIHEKEMKLVCQRDLLTPVFTAAVLTIAKK